MAVVVLLFLQNWRSAIIPLIAVPVAIVGTFAVMAAMGFSLNNLTLFGLVLAIGIVVDDAIVVVEAVEHHIEHGLSPRDATIRAMDEVSGPVIAIGLVLTAVFVPCAFIIGDRRPVLPPVRADDRDLDGHLGVQLADPQPGPGGAAAAAARRRATQRGAAAAGVRACSAAGSATRCLRPELARRARRRSALARGRPRRAWWTAAGASAVVAGAVARLARRPAARTGCWAGSSGCSTRASTARRTSTPGVVGMLLRVSVLVLLVYGGLLVPDLLGLHDTRPTGFIPSQDMGYLLVNVQLPDSASAERTQAVMDQLEQIAHETPGVKHTQTIAGPVAPARAPTARTSARCSSSSTRSRTGPTRRTILRGSASRRGGGGGRMDDDAVDLDGDAIADDAPASSSTPRSPRR